MKRALTIGFVFLFALTVVVSAGAQGSLKLPPYKKVPLKNGLTLLLMEQHEVPIISFQWIVRAGAVADPAGKMGVASLTADLLRKGTKTRSADQLSAELDFIGGLLDADASLDYTTGRAEFLKKDIAKGLDLLSDVLLNPTFPQDEVTKLLRQRIDGVRAAKDQAQGVIRIYYLSYLYEKHPYGRPTDGDETSLAAVTRDDVLKFYQTYYAPGNTILAVVGHFNTPEMERMLEEKFGAWADKMTTAVALPEPAPVTGKKLLLVDKPDSTQTFFCFGNLGIAQTNPDSVYIEVINTLFGGRFTSMLNSELRINSGLTYGAFSYFDLLKTRGPFTASSYTPNATTEKALDLALDVLKRLHEKGVTQEQLDSAKSYIKGQFPPDIETTSQLAALLTRLEFYGLDRREVDEYFAKIDSMTLADARRVIQQYFPLENLTFVLIGKSSEIHQLAKKYAPKIDTKSITQPGF